MILSTLAAASGAMMLRDLADAVGIAPLPAHTPIWSACAKSAWSSRQQAGRYALGPFALQLGLSRLRGQDAYQEAIKRAPALAEDTKLMVAISVWGLHGATIVYTHESPSRVHANVRPGGIFMTTLTRDRPPVRRLPSRRPYRAGDRAGASGNPNLPERQLRHRRGLVSPEGRAGSKTGLRDHLRHPHPRRQRDRSAGARPRRHHGAGGHPDRPHAGHRPLARGRGHEPVCSRSRISCPKISAAPAQGGANDRQG